MSQAPPPSASASPCYPGLLGHHGAQGGPDPASGVSPGQSSVDSGYVYGLDFSPAPSSFSGGGGLGPASVASCSSSAFPPSNSGAGDGGASGLRDAPDDPGFVGSPAGEQQQQQHQGLNKEEQMRQIMELEELLGSDDNDNDEHAGSSNSKSRYVQYTCM